MKKTRRRYDRAFKISVVAELESGKPLVQIAREYSIDLGVQYASHDYVDCLNQHKILISMSRKGNPYDNAFAESFIKTLKVEEVYLNEYETFEDAYRNIWRFIEMVYNHKRLQAPRYFLWVTR
jgi:transposase InsO family protein